TFIAMNGVKPQSRFAPDKQVAKAVEQQKASSDSYVAAKPAQAQALRRSAVSPVASARAKKAEINGNVSNGELPKKTLDLNETKMTRDKQATGTANAPVAVIRLDDRGLQVVGGQLANNSNMQTANGQGSGPS